MSRLADEAAWDDMRKSPPFRFEGEARAEMAKLVQDLKPKLNGKGRFRARDLHQELAYLARIYDEPAFAQAAERMKALGIEGPDWARKVEADMGMWSDLETGFAVMGVQEAIAGGLSPEQAYRAVAADNEVRGPSQPAAVQAVKRAWRRWGALTPAERAPAMFKGGPDADATGGLAATVAAMAPGDAGKRLASWLRGLLRGEQRLT